MPGIERTMVVDTGAICTILSPRVVVWRRLEPVKRNVVLLTATGEQTVVYGKCNVNIEIGLRCLHHRA